MKEAFIIIFSFINFICFGNNVQVSNISLTGQNTASSYKLVEFDISWENSWRTSAAPSNYDAVWVFCKYRKLLETNWQHTTLNTTSSNHSSPSGSTLDVSSDGLGVFIYRSADGSGTSDFDNVQLRWEYGTDGLLANDSVEICVYAIEMVNIPTGDFFIGDGSGSAESPRAFHGLENTAVQITSTLVSDVDTDSGVDDATLYSSGIGIDGDAGLDENDDGTIDHPDFPIGYEAFYIMKYEMSQGQYAAFLNKLTTVQDANRYLVTTAYRYSLSGTAGSRYASAPSRAMNYISYMDLAAYADWAGLRPMTELEFEKAARGASPSTYQEYVWGTGNINLSTDYSLNFDGLSNAIITNPVSSTGNSLNSSTNLLSGPFRCGIFAASSPNNTREETGGSYYGVMELSGNIAETVIHLGDATGRNYDGSHGDGVLSSDGFATNTGWPGYSGSTLKVSLATGTGLRGGAWALGYTYSRLSDRTYMNSDPTTRIQYVGGRLVRTAP